MGRPMLDTCGALVFISCDAPPAQLVVFGRLR